MPRIQLPHMRRSYPARNETLRSAQSCKHECPAPTRGRGRITRRDLPEACAPRKAEARMSRPPQEGAGIIRRDLPEACASRKAEARMSRPHKGAGENHTARLKEACAPRKAEARMSRPHKGAGHSVPAWRTTTHPQAYACGCVVARLKELESLAFGSVDQRSIQLS